MEPDDYLTTSRRHLLVGSSEAARRTRTAHVKGVRLTETLGLSPRPHAVGVAGGDSGHSRFQDYSPRGIPTRAVAQIRMPRLGPHPPALPPTAKTLSPRTPPRLTAASQGSPSHLSPGGAFAASNTTSPPALAPRSLLPLHIFDPEVERDAAWRQTLPKRSRRGARAEGVSDVSPVDAAAASVHALSRYVLPGGGVEWAPCEVLGHEPDEEVGRNGPRSPE